MTNITDAPTWAETVELRAQLHANGWKIVPIAERIKAPVFAAWPSYQYRPEDPETPTPRTKNKKGQPTRAPHFGTGAITTGTVAIDFDIEDPARARAARVAFETVADTSPVVRFRDGSPRIMLFYAPGDGVENLSASIGEDPAKIEIFGNHGGRQVMIHGRHPSGAMLQYEGDAPEDWPIRELPKLDRSTLNSSFQAALDAAEITTSEKIGAAGASVRKQPSKVAATVALGEELKRIFSGDSVHRASNAAADLMAFHLDLDAEQGARILAAIAYAGASINPGDLPRYQEMAAKAQSRAGWYAHNNETPPEDMLKLRFWRRAQVRRFKRAWDLLPSDLRNSFLASAQRAKEAE